MQAAFAFGRKKISLRSMGREQTDSPPQFETIFKVCLVRDWLLY
jgi:hypothetical protein